MGVIADRIRAEVEANSRLLAEEVKNLMDEKVGKAVKIDAMKEFSVYQKSKIESLFRESVKEFYDAYPALTYDRRGSLYNVLKMEEDGSGQVGYESTRDLYDTSAVVGRDGTNLFDRIFIQGYHGGGGNPPRYRIPYGLWYMWGDYATATTSPDEIFSEKLSKAESGEMFEMYKAIVNKHNDKAMKEIYELIPGIQRKYFG